MTYKQFEMKELKTVKIRNVSNLYSLIREGTLMCHCSRNLELMAFNVIELLNSSFVEKSFFNINCKKYCP